MRFFLCQFLKRKTSSIPFFKGISLQINPFPYPLHRPILAGSMDYLANLSVLYGLSIYYFLRKKNYNLLFLLHFAGHQNHHFRVIYNHLTFQNFTNLPIYEGSPPA
mgnify:CR=1 FL=1